MGNINIPLRMLCKKYHNIAGKSRKGEVTWFGSGPQEGQVIRSMRRSAGDADWLALKPEE